MEISAALWALWLGKDFTLLFMPVIIKDFFMFTASNNQ